LIGKAIGHGDLGRSVLAIRDRPQGASLSHRRKPTINLLGAKGQLKLACSQAAERVETTFLTIRWGANEKSGLDATPPRNADPLSRHKVLNRREQPCPATELCNFAMGYV
jgi:hypothetical protein